VQTLLNATEMTSALGKALAVASRAAVLGLGVAYAEARAAEAETPYATVVPTCLSAVETREAVRARKLLEPFAALKVAAAQRKAEALSARLCHRGEEYIYEIILLHRDGRLVHVEIEAQSGRLVSGAPRESK
jgi:uncharacterized membrane protein YkoI